MSIQETIKTVAQSYEGQKEINGNQGWIDKDFEEKMKSLGWQKGQSWCGYFVMLVMRESYANYPAQLALIKKNLTAGAVMTFENCSKNKSFVCNAVPELGDIVVWQDYENKNGVLTATWQGHIGIVLCDVKDSGKHIITLEGNTNDDGAREGYEVARRERHLAFGKVPGLTLLGFIKPLAV